MQRSEDSMGFTLDLWSWLDCGMIFMQGINFELENDVEEKDALQEIVNNTKLSEGYLTLARDIEVMEPKSPEDIYKVFVLLRSHYSYYYLI